jgi:hypothetical protein
LSSLFEAVRPRGDVLAGELTEARFAAGLEEVVDGTAPDTYADPAAFFASTYPSAGLRTLLNEALGRLGGGKPDGASVIRLETNLGGGKTHNLIGLYHAARGHLDRALAHEFMDPQLLPTQSVDRIGVFVGTSAGATTFPEVGGMRPSTLWGYLALQIGGQAGYEQVRADDEDLTAPGADALQRVLGPGPVLILIDEIARYYATARGKEVGGNTLADQTTAFLMALMEAVDSLPGAVLVVTTSEVTDVFGEATGTVLEVMAQARSLLARKELVLRPSEEADLPRILARRLFEPLMPPVASRVAERYAAAADTAASQGLDLPDAMTGAGWATEVARTYPFHPVLIRVLDKRLSTIPNFQRTRGALRLLARVVRRLWEDPPEGAELIHLHHIDLADRLVAEEMSSRLERPLLEPVIRADIASGSAGELSHAEQVDARLGVSYARRLATAAYLYSLTRDVPGVPAGELFGAVLMPGDDANLIVRALDGLEAECWYLHADARGYRFSTEASLVKLIQEAEREVSATRARAKATQILAEQFRDGAFKVRRAWEDAKIPDSADDAWLVVLHWDDFGDARGLEGSDEVPVKVRELFERTPAGGVREYRNRLVFLAPAAASHEAMVRTVRHHLALEALAGNAVVLEALPEEKRAEIKQLVKTSALEARVAVCNHVNLLYVPGPGGLESVELDLVTSASVQPNQTSAILERLAAMDKTLASGDKPLDPGYIRSKLGALLDTPQPTNELVRAFARRTDLKLVLDRAQLVNLVAAGVRNRVWEYQDPERGEQGWATADRPPLAVRLSEDTFLHPVGSAPPPQPLACPLCGRQHSGACPGPGGPGEPPLPAGSAFHGSGAAGRAFSEARAAAVEAGRGELRELRIAVDHVGAGAGTELARLHTVVPAATLGVALTYEVDCTVALSDPTQSAIVRYHGNPSDYAPLREALRQLLAPRQATLRAELLAVFSDPPSLSGDEVGRMAQAAADTGPTRCQVTLVTEAGP